MISCLAIFTAACGSSGGGSGGGSTSSAIQYTGLTTQATIDDSNSQDIAAGSYQGGVTGSALTASGVVQSENTAEIGRPRAIALTQIFQDALQEIDITSFSTTGFSGVMVTPDPKTIQGDCGGEIAFNMSYDDATGDFNGTMNFNGYCSEGAVISGSVDFSGKLNMTTEELLYFNFSFNNVSTVSGGDSFTCSGTMYLDFTVSPETATINMLMKDNVSGKVCKIEDFIMTFNEGSGYVDIEMSGRFYDPNYGYVDLSTPVAFRFHGNDEWPSDGKLVIIGKDGTSAELIALSPTHCEINADTDGVGGNDYFSGQMLWTDI